MSSQNYPSDSFRFKRAAFYQSLKSKVGLAASKAAALRINLNIEGCGLVTAPVHAPSRAPLLLSLLLSHNLPPPPRSLVRDGEASPLRPRLVVSRSTCPPLSPSPHANSFVIDMSEFSDDQSVNRSQATSFLFQFTEDSPNRDRFKKHLVPAVFSRFRN
jgi:hypothetical protein